MNRRLFGRSGLIALAAAPWLATRVAQADEPRLHRVVLHVGGDSAAEMNTALNNILNVADYYAKLGKPVAIDLVANGPGYAMMRDDVSPVKARLAEMHKQLPAVVFSACQNSRAMVARREGKTLEQIVEVPEATDVPAGIVRLSELQEQGWSYIRV